MLIRTNSVLCSHASYFRPRPLPRADAAGSLTIEATALHCRDGKLFGSTRCTHQEPCRLTGHWLSRDRRFESIDARAVPSLRSLEVYISTTVRRAPQPIFFPAPRLSEKFIDVLCRTRFHLAVRLRLDTCSIMHRTS